jgi:hypothetical protein
MRKHGRTDANQAAIVEALARTGWLVVSLADVGGGCPDLLIAKAGRLLLCEVKDGSQPPSRRRLTPDQRLVTGMFNKKGVEILLLASVEDALALNARTR